jgi:hypothetical protein
MPPVTATGFESPSLGSPGDGAGPAFELKFLLEETRARAVEDWARRRLALDPHGDPALGGAYRTTSLYCDTPQRDVYHRTEPYKGHKFRVRRYGSVPWAFLERKSKEADRVAKKRTPIPEEELALLAHPTSRVKWPGRWFHRSLLAYRLLPVCRVTYQRMAFAGSRAEGPLRLTLDQHVHGTVTDEWDLAPAEGGLPLLAGQVILEFKFRGALPALFQELVRELGLSPSTVSKYRLCREAWGIAMSLPGGTP